MGRLLCSLRLLWVGAALSIPAVAAGIGPTFSIERPNDPLGVEPALAGGEADAGDTGPGNLWSGDWDRDWNLDPKPVGSTKTITAVGDAATTPDDPERVYQPDEVLSLNLSPKGFRAARDLGFQISRPHRLQTTGLTLTRMRTRGGLAAADALTALRQRDPKGFYDLNPIYRLASAGAVACSDVRCYPHSLIAWSKLCNVKARIGLLDSAVDRTHVALAGSRIRALRLGPGEPSVHEIEHGTAVAALLVGAKSSAFPGLLPEAELITADVFRDDGQGRLYTDAARMSAGLDWIAGHDPAAINVSITGADSGVLHTVVHRITRSGIPVVAAVGNDGPDALPAYPAAYEEVIAVTAVDSKMQVYARANQGRHVALAAPGVDVWTPGPGTRGVLREGTSFAVPFVTAALARLRIADPRSTPPALAGRLRKTAKHLGPPGDNPVFGSGLVQAGCGGS